MNVELTESVVESFLDLDDIDYDIENNLDVDVIKKQIYDYVKNSLEHYFTNSLLWSDCDPEESSTKFYFSVNKNMKWERTGNVDTLMRWIGEKKVISMVEIEDGLL